MLSLSEVQEDQSLEGNATGRLQSRYAQSHLRFLFSLLWTIGACLWNCHDPLWILGSPGGESETHLLWDSGQENNKISNDEASSVKRGRPTYSLIWSILLFPVYWAILAVSEEFQRLDHFHARLLEWSFRLWLQCQCESLKSTSERVQHYPGDRRNRRTFEVQ